MKKLTKLMLTLTLLVLGVGGVNGRTTIDMSTATAGGEATWNSATNTFSWTAENDYVVIPNLSGDLTGAYLTLNIGGACRIDIVYNDNSETKGDWNGYGRFGSAGTKTQDLGLMAGDKINIVKEVRVVSTSNKAGNMTITDVSYFFPVVPKFNASGIANISLKSLVASGSLSFDSTTGLVTYDGTEEKGELSLEFLSSGIDFTALKRFDVTISGTDNLFNNNVMRSQGTQVLAYYGSRWGGNLKPEERAKATAVNEFKWQTKEASTLKELSDDKRSFTITSITLTADEMNVINSHDVPIASLTHYTVASDGTISEAPITTSYGVDADNPLGDGADDNDEYIDIQDYDELRIYTSSYTENYPRVFFFNANLITEGTSSTKGTTVYLNDPIFAYNSTDGYYYASVSDIKAKCNGIAKVIGVKKYSWSSSQINVSKIQVYKYNPVYDYILSGQYSADVDISAFTSDANVKAVDCTGLSGNNISLSSANPNCLFVASSGKLANSKNVIVGTTCANLVLTDKKPFKAPFSFDATDATLNREVSNGGFATICAPFAITGATGTFYQPKELTAGGVLNFEEATPEAGKAYLFKASADVTAFTGSGTVVAEPIENGTGVVMKGTFSQIAKVDEGSYILSGSSLYKVDSDVALAPFRAYFEVPAVAPARINLHFDEETTGIEAVNSSMNNVEGYYNLNGQRVAQTTKGLYIVNGKKVMVK